MKAFLALYDGAYGKTIRIEIRDRAALKQLYKSFRMLGTGEKDMVTIDGQEDKKYNVSGMALKTGLNEEISAAGNADDITIVWQRDKEGWRYVKDLTAPLLTSDFPCEQDIETDTYFIEIEWNPGSGNHSPYESRGQAE